jgi:hypothetical protein
MVSIIPYPVEFFKQNADIAHDGGIWPAGTVSTTGGEPLRAASASSTTPSSV